VLDGISLRVGTGEFVSVFGPNGSGKTTLLNVIACFVQPEQGSVFHNANGNERVGIVFQNYEKALFPWRNCADNIGFPLERDGNLSKQERRDRAASVVAELGLRLPLGHYPYEMSGGQKQLTSLARAMVAKPTLLLLDEPFASLDYQTRMDMQRIMQDIWMKTRVTTVFVSHEIDEALFLADRLILLTPRPARVAKEYVVPFARPRTVECFSSKEFVDLRSAILHDFLGLT
jgi:NitT/TauT family transport system ATP-binding protein